MIAVDTWLETQVPIEAPFEVPDDAARGEWWRCAVCAKICGLQGGPLHMCALCGGAWYCSVEHQNGHWKEHRPLCLATSVNREAPMPAPPLFADDEDEETIDGDLEDSGSITSAG